MQPQLPLYQTNPQRLIGVLQQWQLLLAPLGDALTARAPGRCPGRDAGSATDVRANYTA